MEEQLTFIEDNLHTSERLPKNLLLLKPPQHKTVTNSPEHHNNNQPLNFRSVQVSVDYG